MQIKGYTKKSLGGGLENQHFLNFLVSLPYIDNEF